MNDSNQEVNSNNNIKQEKISEEEQKDNNNLKEEICRLQEKIYKLQEENSRLCLLRERNAYGYNNSYFITEEKLIEIDFNKYFIEIDEGIFVDVKQVYMDNKESVTKQKIKKLLEEEKNSPIVFGGRCNKKTLEYGIKLGKIIAYEELLQEYKKKEVFIR